MQLEEFRLLGSFIWKFFHPFENGIYSQNYIVALAKLFEVGPEFLIVGTCNLISVAVFMNIAFLQAGEMPVQGVVKIFPVSFAQA